MSVSVPGERGGGGGGTLIFSYMPRLLTFLGSKFLISIFFGGFRKMNIFGVLRFYWGVLIFFIFLGER